jgi:hypothetical protein
MTTITKVQSAQPAGTYTSTNVDEIKQVVDFRITQMFPAYIRWADGRVEMVTAAKLKRLKNKFTWTTDF